MRRVLSLSLLTVLVSLPVQAQRPISRAGSNTLQVGVTLERTISPGAAHQFDLPVTEPSYVQLVVEQHNIDLVVRVIGPNSRTIGEFDSPNGDNGPEEVSFVAPVANTYYIFVTPLNSDGPPTGGSFEITLQEFRAATDDELKSAKNFETLKTKGQALLTDIESAIPQLRSPETRIRMQVQVANLILPWDQPRGMKVLTAAMDATKELLSDMQSAIDENDMNAYDSAKQLRIEVFEVVSQQDADIALDFMRSTRPLIRTRGNNRHRNDEEATLEVILANRLSSSDPKKALKLAEDNLKTGYSLNLLQTVQHLRNKEPELATKLAKEMVDKLLTEKLVANQEAGQLAVGLLRLVQQNPNRPRVGLMSPPNPATSGPVLEDSDVKALLQKILDEVNNVRTPNSPSRENSGYMNLLYSLKSMSAQLESMAPGSSASIEKKFSVANEVANPGLATLRKYQDTINTSTPESALEQLQKAPEEYREQLIVQLADRVASAGDLQRARQIVNDNLSDPYQKQQVINNLERQAMFQSANKGRFDEAIRRLNARKPSQDRTSQIAQLIGQMGRNLKRAQALNLLGQFRTMLSPSAQADNQDTMGALFELSRVYARYDKDQAFETLEPLVEQFNQLGDAAKTMNGFGQFYFQNEELMVQNGNPIGNAARQMASTIGALSVADFERAVTTADKIRLSEIRVLAYLEIARQTIAAK